MNLTLKTCIHPSIHPVYTKTQVDRVIRNVVWDVVFGHKPQTTVTYYRASHARNCVCVMLQRYEYYYKDMPVQ